MVKWARSLNNSFNNQRMPLTMVTNEGFLIQRQRYMLVLLKEFCLIKPVTKMRWIHLTFNIKLRL